MILVTYILWCNNFVHFFFKLKSVYVILTHKQISIIQLHIQGTYAPVTVWKHSVMNEWYSLDLTQVKDPFTIDCVHNTRLTIVILKFA